jgi:hypothetical protein
MIYLGAARHQSSMSSSRVRKDGELMPSRVAYDSTHDTLAHIHSVQTLLMQVMTVLQARLIDHDGTKLESPEKELFDAATPQLWHLTYGSAAYQESLGRLSVALDHHYAVYRHHPEHFAECVDGMTLIDLIEMLTDWKAASERQHNGDLRAGLTVNVARFGISEQLANIITNTINEMHW